MTRQFQALAMALVLFAAACAGRSGTAGLSATVGGWSGSFRQDRRAVDYGSISLAPVEGRQGYFRVELAATAPADLSTQIAWAIASGPCGSSGPAVAGIKEFPPIELTPGGAFYSGVMALSMEPKGSYRADIYWTSKASNGTNAQMLCANLTQ